MSETEQQKPQAGAPDKGDAFKKTSGWARPKAMARDSNIAAWLALLGIVFLGLGFTFLAGVWTSCAQKAFGNYILPQFESGQFGGKQKMEARRGVNPYKEAKAKRKAQEGSAIAQAARARAEDSAVSTEEVPQEKKKKQPTKHVSYKRKK